MPSENKNASSCTEARSSSTVTGGRTKAPVPAQDGSAASPAAAVVSAEGDELLKRIQSALEEDDSVDLLLPSLTALQVIPNTGGSGAVQQKAAEEHKKQTEQQLEAQREHMTAQQRQYVAQKLQPQERSVPRITGCWPHSPNAPITATGVASSGGPLGNAVSSGSIEAEVSAPVNVDAEGAAASAETAKAAISGQTQTGDHASCVLEATIVRPNGSAYAEPQTMMALHVSECQRLSSTTTATAETGAAQSVVAEGLDALPVATESAEAEILAGSLGSLDVAAIPPQLNRDTEASQGDDGEMEDEEGFKSMDRPGGICLRGGEEARGGGLENGTKAECSLTPDEATAAAAAAAVAATAAVASGSDAAAAAAAAEVLLPLRLRRLGLPGDQQQLRRGPLWVEPPPPDEEDEGPRGPPPTLVSPSCNEQLMLFLRRELFSSDLLQQLEQQPLGCRAELLLPSGYEEGAHDGGSSPAAAAAFQRPEDHFQPVLRLRRLRTTPSRGAEGAAGNEAATDAAHHLEENTGRHCQGPLVVDDALQLVLLAAIVDSMNPAEAAAAAAAVGDSDAVVFSDQNRKSDAPEAAAEGTACEKDQQQQLQKLHEWLSLFPQLGVSAGRAKRVPQQPWKWDLRILEGPFRKNQPGHPYRGPLSIQNVRRRISERQQRLSFLLSQQKVVCKAFYKAWRCHRRQLERHRLAAGDLFGWGVLPVRAVDHPSLLMALPAGFRQGNPKEPYEKQHSRDTAEEVGLHDRNGARRPADATGSLVGGGVASPWRTPLANFVVSSERFGHGPIQNTIIAHAICRRTLRGEACNDRQRAKEEAASRESKREWMQANFSNLTGPGVFWRDSCLFSQGQSLRQRFQRQQESSGVHPVELLQTDPDWAIFDWERECGYTCNSTRVFEPVEQEAERKAVTVWAESEARTFVEKFLMYPKNFEKIAACLDGKTTRDCVDFYYRFKFKFGLKRRLQELEDGTRVKKKNRHIGSKQIRREELVAEAVAGLSSDCGTSMMRRFNGRNFLPFDVFSDHLLHRDALQTTLKGFVGPGRVVSLPADAGLWGPGHRCYVPSCFLIDQPQQTQPEGADTDASPPAAGPPPSLKFSQLDTLLTCIQAASRKHSQQDDEGPSYMTRSRAARSRPGAPVATAGGQAPQQMGSSSVRLVGAGGGHSGAGAPMGPGQLSPRARAIDLLLQRLKGIVRAMQHNARLASRERRRSQADEPANAVGDPGMPSSPITPLKLTSDEGLPPTPD
ncbi:myb-like DNA-binding domain-containing protein [Cyclospora cayetanensis]|uniref:Myb-like DNA-binding domain-containing protein n=1 Tax=Cyclospora cayetanensis TaxID=88456 RepID=A0A1D3D4C6_9EIME|nr:myb-like DNA-binding domain-containing protein [Cyclospora cayetanensis]